MDYTTKSCREFVTVLASNEPAPGGGGASALVAAIGTALGNMVGSLTVGKKKYADVEAEIIALQKKCDALQTELLDQVPADAEGFIPLANAYGIPKDDPTGPALWRRPPSPHARCLCTSWSCAARPSTPSRCSPRRAPVWRCPTRLRRNHREGGIAGGVPERVHQHQDLAEP